MAFWALLPRPQVLENSHQEGTGKHGVGEVDYGERIDPQDHLFQELQQQRHHLP